MAVRNSELLVVEYNGTPRSGKGTAVGHFGRTRDRVATDETGADYRAITRGLLAEGIIEEGMSKEVIQANLARVSVGRLVELAAGRKHIIEAHGFQSLYEADVNGTVGDVAPITDVRNAVKDGFKERVRQVRDSGDHELLAIDGRNLAPVINAIEGTRLIMRTFVTAHPTEAALRECTRLGVDPQSPEGEAILARTIKRQNDDASRENDPVRPDEDALTFAHGVYSRENAIYWLADQMFGGNEALARQAMYETLVQAPKAEVPPRELGRRAVLSGRQILFDTTAFRGYQGNDDPRARMLDEFDQMLDDALDTIGVKV